MGTKRQNYIDFITADGVGSLVNNQEIADVYKDTLQPITFGLSPANGKWEIDEYGSLTDAIGGTCPAPTNYKPEPGTFTLNSTFNLSAPNVTPETLPMEDLNASEKISAPEPEFPPPPVPPAPGNLFGKKGRKQ